MKYKSKVLVILIIVTLMFSVVMATACSPAQRPGPMEKQTPAPAPITPSNSQESERAKEIAEEIGEMKNVNNATVVITENQAWVGVDLAADLEDEMTDEMKDEITELVKEEDKEIDRVYVTADADTVTRLRNIARDIADGKPISGFVNELNEIGRRLTPSQQ